MGTIPLNPPYQRGTLSIVVGCLLFVIGCLLFVNLELYCRDTSKNMDSYCRLGFRNETLRLRGPRDSSKGRATPNSTRH